MEDPWSSGAAWAQPSKEVDQVQSPTPSSLPVRTPPLTRLDNTDPWGAPTPAPLNDANASAAFDWQPSSTRNDAEDSIGQTPSWGGGWGEEAPAGPSRSPAQPAASPLWEVPDRSPEESGVQAFSPTNLPVIDDLEIPARLSLNSPPSESRGFEVDVTPVSPSQPDDKADVEQEIALPISPNFGEDFGGFSSGFGDDPWGPKKVDATWGPSSSRRSSPQIGGRDGFDNGNTVDDGWGEEDSRQGARAETPQKSGMDEDWEEAQKRIRVTEARAPRERIAKLQGEWRELAEGFIGVNRLPPLGSSDDDDDVYEERLRRQRDETHETLRSLSTIPPDTNTYPPILTSLETHERYQYALSRPNPTPNTSLLNIPVSRRSRHTDNVQENLESWTSRSRLGEPEALTLETAPQAEEARPKWSFWRKNTAEKSLVTSGGGLLEVKSLSSPPVPLSNEPRPSISSALSGSATKGSRPASPAPSLGAAIETPPVVPSTATSPEPVIPAQSAVTRFFGRLSRKPTTQQAAEDEDKEMQLSADDFSFLDQVPSISGPAPEGRTGDLLAFGGGRTEEMASLESMISSKAVPLPAPLAPPPAWSRSSSSAGPAKHQANEVNIFDDLDFGSPSTHHYSPAMQPNSSSQAQTGPSKSVWDDFLAPSQPSVPSSTLPMIHSTSRPESHAASTTHVSGSPSASVPQPPRDLASPIAGPSRIGLVRSSAPDENTENDGFDDFADFAPPPTSKVGDFDDFGDFSEFSTPPPPSMPYESSTSHMGPASQPQAPPSTSHIKRASLDHTMTLNLVKDASATKGKRWPAPPSPLVPQLEPPPKASGSGANFPFLSPPPGSSRPINGFGDLLNTTVNEITPVNSNSDHIPTPPRIAHQVPFATSAPLVPVRPLSPLSRPSSAAGGTTTVNRPQQSQSGQSGLSAQDLSFFDNL